LIVEKTGSEDSFMIPDVDEYVIKKDFDEKKIYVRNISDLIDL
jgi:ribosomal 30S subunit maturation factor RimM